jgi:DNA-3-methyladenine glycosylase II
VAEQLIQVRGIGQWTVDMFLIFHLGRPDVLPVGDLGLRRAAVLAYRPRKPRTRLKRLARPWRPWRSVATWYLWASLRVQPA